MLGIKKHHVVFYFLYCIIGPILEWCYGAYWDMVGTTPWIYPDSPLRYASLEMVPLWGFGGLICASVYLAVTRQRAVFLLGTIPPLVLAALWILIYARFIA